jgi:hypothetical protein
MMGTSEESVPISRTGRTLSATAWVMLGYVTLGYATLLPSVGLFIDRLDQTIPGRVGIMVVFVGFVGTALALWWTAIIHAREVTERGSVKRILLIGTLIVTNFAGGFLYYFGYAMWRQKAAGRGPTVLTDSQDCASGPRGMV